MKTIGKYQVAEEIGRSAAGVTCRARDPFRNREYVLKILSPLAALSAGSKEQLYRDLSASWELTHRHIAKVHDIGELEGILYIATELLTGSSLMSVLSSGNVPIAEKLTLVAQACEALACAHSKGIAHGNLKPGNIFVTDTGYATILDFGTGTWQNLLLASGVRLNGLVPNYLAPEQILGEPFDSRSDIFALGVMLYEILAGHYPFQGAPGVIPREIVHAQPEPLRKWNAQIPEDLEEIAFHAIKKDPRERFQSADEFAASLYHVAQRIRTEPSAPAPEIVAPPLVEVGVAEQPAAETIDAAHSEIAPAAPEPAVPAAGGAAIAEVVEPEPIAAQISAAQSGVQQSDSEQLNAPQTTAPSVSAPVEADPAPVALAEQPAALPNIAIPAEQPAARPPIAHPPAPPANIPPAPPRQQTRLAPQKSPATRKRRLATFAMGGLMALSMIGVIVVRQNMAAPGVTNPPAAPAAPPAEAPSLVPEAGKPTPFEPAPERPVQPPPVAPTPEQAAAEQILRSQVRPLWEAGQYAEAMRVVDEVLASSPANAEARAWKKKIHAAQEAEADIK